jgi:hypothetical protein
VFRFCDSGSSLSLNLSSLMHSLSSFSSSPPLHFFLPSPPPPPPRPLPPPPPYPLQDLGQIEYVLSDKTGTLTENVMVLKVCTVLGKQYGVFDADAGEWHAGVGLRAMGPGGEEGGAALSASTFPFPFQTTSPAEAELWCQGKWMQMEWASQRRA